MKKEIDRLDATPSKRLFLSIIADYDLNRSICELIDNGLDVWVKAPNARAQRRAWDRLTSTLLNGPALS